MPSPARARSRRVRRRRRGEPRGRADGQAVRGQPRRRPVVIAMVACAAAVAAAFWLSLPSAEPLKTGNPKSTALIDARAREAAEKGRAARRNQHWVPLARISPWLQRAVVNSEDARFFVHHGVDVVETGVALEQ